MSNLNHVYCNLFFSTLVSLEGERLNTDTLFVLLSRFLFKGFVMLLLFYYFKGFADWLNFQQASRPTHSIFRLKYSVFKKTHFHRQSESEALNSVHLKSIIRPLLSQSIEIA